MSLRKELESLIIELQNMSDGEYLDLYNGGIRQGKRISALKLKAILKKYPKVEKDGQLNDE